jgi:hypothetical protein
MIVEAHDVDPARPGTVVGLDVKAEQAMFFDAETEARIR